MSPCGLLLGIPSCHCRVQPVCATMAVKAEGSQRTAAVSLGAWGTDHVSRRVISDPLLFLHAQVYFCASVPGTCSRSIIHVLSLPMSLPFSVPGSRDEHWLHSLREARPGGAVNHAARKSSDRQLPQPTLPPKPGCPPPQQGLLAQLHTLLLR